MRSDYAIMSSTHSIQSVFNAPGITMRVISSKPKSKCCMSCCRTLGLFSIKSTASGSYKYLYPGDILMQADTSKSGFKTVWLCSVCVAKMEMAFLRKMEKEKLPLFINHRWLAECSGEKYLQIWKDLGYGTEEKD